DGEHDPSLAELMEAQWEVVLKKSDWEIEWYSMNVLDQIGNEFGDNSPDSVMPPRPPRSGKLSCSTKFSSLT
ncbi:MAG: hypothetical protein L0215_22645, partial [Gemmataceae bacterium]|nr:hypothetical protein [Gemmataceae bacterium]